MEPAWAKDFPRLYELYRESEQDSETNYFKDFDSVLTIPPDKSPARSSYERLEKELGELDKAAWQELRQKALKCITIKNELRGHNQLFECLNEAKGYLYLNSEGYKEIHFIPKENSKTPDLIARRGSSVALLEVKTINESEDELNWISLNSKEFTLYWKARLEKREPPVQRKLVREVRQGLDDSLKCKIAVKIWEAKCQLLGYDIEKVDRRIVYLAIRLDILTAMNPRNIDELAAYIQQQSDNQIEVVHTLL